MLTDEMHFHLVHYLMKVLIMNDTSKIASDKNIHFSPSVVGLCPDDILDPSQVPILAVWV
jgi:hypothetical protein